MQQRNLSITSTISVSYNTTNAWADVIPATGPSLVITAPEDGVYDIFSMGSVYNNAPNDSTNTRLAINGNPIDSTQQNGEIIGAGITALSQFTAISFNVLLKAGDDVSLQAKYGASATNVYYSAASSHPSITIIKRGV